MNWFNLADALAVLVILAAGVYTLAKGRARCHHLLGLADIFTALAVVAMNGYGLPGISGEWWSDILFISLGLVSPILYYLSICEFTRMDGASFWDYAIIYPAVFIVMGNCLCYAVMTPDVLHEYMSQVLGEGHLAPDASRLFVVKRVFGSWLFRFVLFSECLLIVIVAFTQVARNRKTLDEYYTSIKKEWFQGFNLLKYGLILSIVAIILICYRPYSELPVYQVKTTLAVALLALVSVMMSIFFAKHNFAIQDLKMMIYESDQEKDPDEIQFMSRDRILAGIQAAVDARFYLDPDVTLVSFADSLKTNRTYVSATIHDRYGENFADFVNSRRVGHAKQLIDQFGYDDRLIKELVADSGFTSPSSFLRNFRKYTGMTPHEWAKREK